MKLTIFKYIFHEIWPTFIASLLVFIFIVLAARMLNIAEWVVNHGVPVTKVAQMIYYLLPGMVLFALPAALLMAVFVAFHRLSSDNEIQALQSSGISLYQMLPPVLAVSIGGVILALFLALAAAPWGNRSFKDLIFQVANSKADLGIRERVFSEPFDGITFYINSFSSRQRIMKDVFLVDNRDPALTNTIVARQGKIFSNSRAKTIMVHFIDGTIFMVDKNLDNVRTIKFKTYDLSIGLKDIMSPLSSRKREPKEMYLGELFKRVKDIPPGEPKHNEMLIQLMERFAIPLAVFLMGIIGAPLGAQIRSRGRILGIVVSLAIFVVYYVFLAGMRSVGETGALSPSIGPWLPDVFLLISCLWLLKRAGEERPISFLDRFLAFQEH